MFMKNVREFLMGYLNCPNLSDTELVDEVLLWKGKKVWSDPDMDIHRWYNRQEVVYELHGYFIKFYDYIITGDKSMGDMDLEYDLDEFEFVEKKEKVTTVTYYE